MLAAQLALKGSFEGSSSNPISTLLPAALNANMTRRLICSYIIHPFH